MFGFQAFFSQERKSSFKKNLNIPNYEIFEFFNIKFEQAAC